MNNESHLETLVKARTEALTDSNAILKKEIEQRKEAERRANHLNRVLLSIKNVDQLIVREKNRNRLIKGACELLIEMRGFHNTWIALLSEKGSLVSAAEAGLGNAFLPLLSQLKRGEFTDCARRALVQSDAVIVKKTATECIGCPLSANYADWGGMSVRLEYGGRIFGVLCAAIPTSLLADQEEQNLFQEVARDIALALHNIESEDKYRNLFDNAVVGIGITNVDGKVFDVNSAMCKITGYTREDFSKLDMAALYADADDRKRFLQVMARDGLAEGFEVRLRKKTGESYWCNLSSRPIVYDGREAFLTTFIDITKRMKTEKRIEDLSLLKEALLGSESLGRKMKRITDSVVDILGADFARIWLTQQGDRCESGCLHAEVVDGPHVCRFRDKCLHLVASSGRYTHVNGPHGRVPFGCYKIGLVAAAEEPGFLTNDVTRDPRVHNHAWALKLGLTSFAGYRLLSHRGDPIGVLALFSRQALSRDEENLLKTLASTASEVIQVTRSAEEMVRLNAALAAKNAELEQVVYVASHDLRSPLVNIDGYSRELAYDVEEIGRLLGKSEGEALSAVSSILENDIPLSLHFIQTSASKMDVLLNGLLKLSRSGRAALNMAPLDMNRLISNVVDAIEFQIREARILLEVETLPPCHSDEVQLNQVFSNLLSNALKYLDPKRSGVIRISGRKKGKQSIYCVEDNGIGIAPAHLTKIFEIFHRLDPDRGEGDGLGLTIVKRILGRLNGSIEVESELGKGTRFYVTVPAVPI